MIKDIPSPISYFIPNYTKYNKGILFLLLEKGFVEPDETFLNQYLRSKPVYKRFGSINNKKEPDMSQTFYYLYPKMKNYLDENLQKQIEEEIFKNYSEKISTFEEKCQIGENDSYVCSLIRSDSVEEFITYVNRTNLPLLTKIKPSVYETHSFLIDKEPTLIEYAAFFGSIQIIQYLKYNNVPLTPSLWLYTIHSNNPELVHFLEENEIKPEKNNVKNAPGNMRGSHLKKEFDDVLIGSIKCHHNDISNYIADNYFEQIQADDQNHIYDSFSDIIVYSLNFFFFPNGIRTLICTPKSKNGFKLSQLCFSLKQITVPSSIIYIEENAFNGCTSLTQIKIPTSVTYIGIYAFNGCTSLTQITIPSSVTEIEDYTFNGCTSLTQITIPSSVTYIGDKAFFYCSSLTQITILSFMISFGKNIFDGIKSIEIAGNIQNIPKGLFSKNTLLTQIAITSPITSIGDNAFFYCSSLTQITIPSSVTSIGNSTFEGCTLLTQITIPSSVTSIGNSAFSKCSSLTKIIIPSSVTKIGDKIFKNCTSLMQITIPSSVTYIGNYAFSSCTSLTQILIPSSVTSIGNYAFAGCSSLTQILIPSSVTSIGNYAFSSCTSLTQITIPSSVTLIGNYAFAGCSSLTQVTIPSSVISIGDSCFYRCPLLSTETIESINNIESNINNNSKL